jgi:FKBP12-rapamycin complex-associated protein
MFHLNNNNNNNNTKRALEVINRIQAKLTGRDFTKNSLNNNINNNNNMDAEELSVEQQVDRLIKEATSEENLCQLFTGWCPLW